MPPPITKEYAHVLADPERLALIEKLDLVDSLPEEVFDRLTRLAARLLPAPVALVSIVDDHRQFFKSFVGLEDPWATKQQTPLSHSFCQHVVVTAKPLVVEDARQHPLVKDNMAIPDLGVVSYLGIPITMASGQTLGSFCVIDSETRHWTEEDIQTMHDLAQSVITEIELRHEVNALRTSEQERNELVAQLKSVNQDLADFAYIISHDLKAPLRGISSIADWLSADYEHILDEDGQELLDLLQKRVNRLQNFIEGVLRYSRVGRIESEWEQVDLQNLIEDVLSTLAPPEHIEILVKDRLPVVFGGRVRLEQVFQNLLSNAIKFLDKPKGLIEISCREKGELWEFCIKDNGPGIEERHFRKIFQMFQTLNPRDEFESTGIGLTLVKKIVGMHGGTIVVQSVVREGTEFIFTIAKTGENHE